MTLMGTDAWRDEAHGRGPDDCAGQVECAKLPWQKADVEPVDREKLIAPVQTNIQSGVRGVLEKS